MGNRHYFLGKEVWKRGLPQEKGSCMNDSPLNMIIFCEKKVSIWDRIAQIWELSDMSNDNHEKIPFSFFFLTFLVSNLKLNFLLQQPKWTTNKAKIMITGEINLPPLPGRLIWLYACLQFRWDRRRWICWHKSDQSFCIVTTMRMQSWKFKPLEKQSFLQ